MEWVKESVSNKVGTTWNVLRRNFWTLCTHTCPKHVGPPQGGQQQDQPQVVGQQAQLLADASQDDQVLK